MNLFYKKKTETSFLRNKIIRNITAIALLAVISSCSEDSLRDPEFPANESDSVVEIFVDNSFDIFSFGNDLSEDFLTRKVDNAKTSFQPGDRIHVQGAFYDGDGEFVENAYKIFEMNMGGVWKVSGENPMLWPPDAKKGKFKAYYIQRYQDNLEVDDIKRTLRLSEIDGQTNPLYAEAEYDWGHKVMLHFNHICTHLTFTKLDPDITDYFWLVNNNKEKPMGNVFKIWLTDKLELETEFASEGDDNYGGLVYVQSRSKNLYEDNIKTGSEVSFFLEPGDYSNVELRTINNYPYLAYRSEATADLQGNVPYVIDIKKNKGVTFVEQEENWEEDESTVSLLDPDEFLQSILEGKDYFVDNNGVRTKILQGTSDGSLLLRNVSFGKKKPKESYSFPTGSVFDGGNHFIEDLTTNLFTTNSGTILHLGLKNVECNDVELSYTATNDNSRWGALCLLNSGDIHNVRIDTADITFSIGDGREDSQYVFNIGVLVGSSPGNLSHLTYDGEIKLKSQQENDVQSKINIGGIVGQSAAIKDIIPADNDAGIEIEIALQGDQTTIYAGGAVGQSGSDIENVSLPKVKVDLSGSKGLVSNAGGIAGRLITTTADPSVISSCTVAGEVKGMPVEAYNILMAFSCTGGLVGYVSSYDVLNCQTICSVSVTATPAEGNITYATGGCLGRIITSTDNISGNYALGSTLTGPDNYIGNFAGLVPVSKNWSDYQAAGNVAKEIIADKFIGGSINDNSNQD